MLTYNLKVVDGLTNGSVGQVYGIKVGSRNQLMEIHVHFVGKNVGIETCKFQYSNVTTCIQGARLSSSFAPFLRSPAWLGFVFYCNNFRLVVKWYLSSKIQSSLLFQYFQILKICLIIYSLNAKKSCIKHLFNI